MRKYSNLPDPTDEPELFNQYLRDNNQVAMENIIWIIIKNSYIENQLVAFCKYPVSTVEEYRKKVHYYEKEAAFLWLFEAYVGKHIYINADRDKSVLKRLHFHIKL